MPNRKIGIATTIIAGLTLILSIYLVVLTLKVKSHQRMDLCVSEKETLLTRDGILLTVSYRADNGITGPKAVEEIVKNLEKGGWKRYNKQRLSRRHGWAMIKCRSGNTTDIEFYSPHPGHGLTVRDEYVNFESDYSGIAKVVDRVQKEHKQTAALIGDKGAWD